VRKVKRVHGVMAHDQLNLDRFALQRAEGVHKWDTF
jgi:hypothetical protein